MSDWDALECDLKARPRFFSEAPTGLRPEIEAQGAFLSTLRFAAPTLMVFANANAGKRNPAKAKREGIKGGVFDLTILGQYPLLAFVEFKGYDKNGRPGKLSQAQVDFGNRCVDLGIPAACFFDPFNAVEWLREQGFPVRELKR